MKKKFTPKSILSSDQELQEYKGYSWSLSDGQLHIYPKYGEQEYIVCELVSGPFDTKPSSTDILCIMRVDFGNYNYPLEDNTIFMFGSSSESIEDVIDTIQEKWE